MGVGGQHLASAALPPTRDAVPIVQEAVWTPGPVWTFAEILGRTGIRSSDRPARNESLYRLRYPGTCTFLMDVNKFIFTLLLWNRMMFVSKGTLERRCVLRRGKLHLQSYYNWYSVFCEVWSESVDSIWLNTAQSVGSTTIDEINAWFVRRILMPPMKEAVE